MPFCCLCPAFMLLLLAAQIDAVRKPRQTGRLEQLYEDLLFHYIPMVRPAEKPADQLLVLFGAHLIQLIEVDEKNQVFRASLWLEMEWYDRRLKWNPLTYGNVTTIHMPSDNIWTPDIVVYNNADGKPQITIRTDVLVVYTGKVIWKPPMIVKSFCEVDIAYFPYDEQRCKIKFGTWSYDGQYVDLDILEQESFNTTASGATIVPGMDLSYYTRSNEWDILNITVLRHEVIYPGCCGQMVYIDITVEFFLRRRPLFYTANMIFPCALIGLLTVFVFWVPPDTRQRMTLCISILVSLSVFFLLLQEIMPATSLSVPLMGKFILFNLISIGGTILVTVITLNIHHRDDNHTMIGRRTKHFILAKVAPWLGIKFPKHVRAKAKKDWQILKQLLDVPSTSAEECSLIKKKPKKQRPYSVDMELRTRQYEAQIVQRAVWNVRFISQHFRAIERRERVSQEWSCLSLVLDRACMWFFSTFTLVAICVFVSQVPYIYDARPSVVPPVPENPLGYTHWRP